MAGIATVRLFRAVSPLELADILNHGAFRAIPSSLEGKWFAETVENASEWGRHLAQLGGGSFQIVQVDIPQNVADTMFCLSWLDQIGPARYAEGDVLKLINQTHLGIVEVPTGSP
jgi:hypothetical protein